jgi:RHS repeat-associated protein
MRGKKIILPLLLWLTVASTAWGAPGNWAIFVPTHAVLEQGSIDGSFYSDAKHNGGTCDSWDLSGIDHFSWECHTQGNPGYLDCSTRNCFDIYSIVGDYYACDGSLVQTDAKWDDRKVVRETGSVFDGGIGCKLSEGSCYLNFFSPARECRVFYPTQPVKRSENYCPEWPYIPPASPDKNLGRPRTDLCESPKEPPVFVGNPINVTTGNKYEEVVDLKVKTPGIPLEFQRAYNSQSDYQGPLGYGWTHNYNLRLEVMEMEPQKRVRIWDGDGQALYFTKLGKKNGSGMITFAGESGVKDRLKQNSNTGQYILRRKGTDLTYRLNSKGRLLEISNPYDNKLTLTYENEQLIQVSNNYGKALSFEYEDGLLKCIRDPKGQPIYYKYKNGDLHKVTYLGEHFLRYEYDQNHNLTDKFDTQDNLIGHWEYDELKDQVRAYYSYIKDGVHQDRLDLMYLFQETQVIRPSGTTTYRTDTINGKRVIKEVLGCGVCGGINKRYDYNERVDLISVTTIRNGREITTRYVYDDPVIPWEQVGILTEKTEALGLAEERTTYYTYKLLLEDDLLVTEVKEKKPSVLFPDGKDKNKVTIWDYAKKGNLLSFGETGYTIINGTKTLQTHTTTFEYNDRGQLIKINGPRTTVADATKLAYYLNQVSEGLNRGQLKAITNSLGHQVLFSDYDANGNVGTITDPNNIAYTYQYDERNRVKTITISTNLEAPIGYGYDDHGNLNFIRFPEGNTLEFTYTPSNRLSLVRDNLGNTIQCFYDDEGNRNLEEVLDPEGNLRKSLKFEYDPFNRLWRIINPDGTFTEYGYDGSNNRTLIQNPRLHPTTFTYDALNRVVRMTQVPNPDNRRENIFTFYGYDPHDNLTSIIDGNRNETQYTFDDFGKLIKTVSPDTGTTKYEYDNAGNLAEKRDAKGGVIKYTYDALDRLKAVKFPDPSQNITHTYDSTQVSYGVGKLTGRTDPIGTYTFHYDPQGNRIKEEKSIGNVTYTTQYTYNKDGTRTSIIYPSGRSVSYGLDGTGRVSDINALLNNNQPLASGINYLPFGRITGFTYGSGFPLDQNYDLQYRLRSIEVGPVLDREYTPDPNGNITNITDKFGPAQSRNFSYDPLDRLVYADGGYATVEYQYDPVGNRRSQTNGKRVDYHYKAGTNQLTGILVQGEPAIALGYDQNGNTDSENGTTFSYDPLGRLAAVWEEGKKLAEYGYDGNGQRVKKVTQEGTRIFHYDLQGHLIAESNENGEIQAEYIYLGNQLLAMILPGEKVYYFHNDHLGTPQVLTDQAGGVVWKADYRPFGEIQVLVEQVENPFRFPGQYYDKETGLHYNYHRYYYPGIGRYVQPDPIGLRGGMNPYVYVRNNPVNFIDPKGLWIWHVLWEFVIALVIEPNLPFDEIDKGEDEWAANRRWEGERMLAEERWKESRIDEYLELAEALLERLNAIKEIYINDFGAQPCPPKKK